MSTKSVEKKSRRGMAVALVAGLAITGVLVGLVLKELYRERTPASESATDTKRAEPAAPGVAGSRSPASRAKTAAALPPPWEATPHNSPPLPEGHIPAWVANPPAPDPNAPSPPNPTPPPDPATHRPPMHNPGGVNGDRPPRPVPTLGRSPK